MLSKAVSKVPQKVGSCDPLTTYACEISTYFEI